MLTRRQRIAAWIKADAQRRADAERLAQITERLTARPADEAISGAAIAQKLWARSVWANMQRPGIFGHTVP